jgi:3'-5' exoribonuclease
MRETFIKNLKAGDTITDIFYVAVAEEKTARNNNSFLNLKLQDKSGQISAKIWDYKEGTGPVLGQYVKVEALVEDYKGQLQLKLKRWRIVEALEVNSADFVPCSERDRGEMMMEVQEWVRRIDNPDLRNLVVRVVTDPEVYSRLKDAPAAKGNHQPYLGGLLEHILNLCSLAESMAQHYADLDQDLLIAAAILHDIGKVIELEWDPAIRYSRRGLLLGHIVIGLQIVDRNMEERKDIIEHLEHIIASHHGLLEWGAAKVPMSREAVIFHLMDMIDSRMGGFDKIADLAVDDQGFTPYQQSFGSQVYMPQRAA